MGRGRAFWGAAGGRVRGGGCGLWHRRLCSNRKINIFMVRVTECGTGCSGAVGAPLLKISQAWAHSCVAWSRCACPSREIAPGGLSRCLPVPNALFCCVAAGWQPPGQPLLTVLCLGLERQCWT